MGTWSFGGGGVTSGGGGSISFGTGGGGGGGSWSLGSGGSGSGVSGGTIASSGGSGSGSFFTGSDPFGINPAASIQERDYQSIHYLGDNPIADMLDPKPKAHGYRDILILAGLLVLARKL